jgi:anti-anti-sigma factor
MQGAGKTVPGGSVVVGSSSFIFPTKNERHSQFRARNRLLGEGGHDRCSDCGQVAMHELQISRHRVHNVEVIELAGAIDALAFADLSAALARIIEETTPNIALNCARVSYIGSAQLRQLTDLAGRARAAGGDIKCVGLAPSIQKIANLISLGDPLECYDEMSDVLVAFHEMSMAVAR